MQVSSVKCNRKPKRFCFTKDMFKKRKQPLSQGFARIAKALNRRPTSVITCPIQQTTERETSNRWPHPNRTYPCLQPAFPRYILSMFSPAMFVATTAYLPTSFALCCFMVAHGSWFLEHYRCSHGESSFPGQGGGGRGGFFGLFWGTPTTAKFRDRIPHCGGCLPSHCRPSPTPVPNSSVERW